MAESHPLEYFMPGDVILTVQSGSDSNEAARTALEELGAEIMDFVDWWSLETDGAPPVMIGETPTHWLLLQSLRPRDREHREALVKETSDLVNRVDDFIMSRAAEGTPTSIVAVSPNWFVPAAQGHTTTGGPGARPVPPKLLEGQQASLDLFRDMSGFAVVSQAKQFLGIPVESPMPIAALHERLGDESAPIEVAVLDTVVPAEALTDAQASYTNFNHLLASLVNAGLDITHADPGLMAILNRPNGTPEVIRSSRSVRAASRVLRQFTGRMNPRDDYLRLRDHKYAMKDHGLFVAGVIHSLAPRARIRLMQVLNDYGTGTEWLLIQALKELLDTADLKNLIVNCSLVINMPRDVAHPRIDLVWSELDERKGFKERMISVVLKLFDELKSRGAQVVAAAGNDRLGNEPPAPRYPAAFGQVLGIGALDNKFRRAWYSNISDDPGNAGIQVFGGTTKQATVHPKLGMIGLYTGAFPHAEGHNEWGWARWAGTSFATPIITGLLALSRGATGCGPDDAVQELHSLCQQDASGEYRLQIVQGL